MLSGPMRQRYLEIESGTGGLADGSTAERRESPSLTVNIPESSA